MDERRSEEKEVLEEAVPELKRSENGGANRDDRELDDVSDFRHHRS